MYDGKITPEFLTEALEAFADYKKDKQPYYELQKDNERFYRSWYERRVSELESKLDCRNSLVFSAIENAVATASENYPVPNILERDESNEEAADALSKVVPIVLEYAGMKNLYKENMRNKCKKGTAIYSVTCNEAAENVDIRIIDFCDFFCDMHVDDIQDSAFVFLLSAVPNNELSACFPEHKDMFTGNAAVETLSDTDTITLKNCTLITDCYYKKDGAVHLIKLCNDEIIAATEDMPGYENGLYNHGLYPFVIDRLYPIDRCPLGFGMIDVAKSAQIQLDKLNNAITENLMLNSKVRFLSKRNGGIDEKDLRNYEKNVVHYDGDSSAIVPIVGKEINANYLSHRDILKDELKEILANRDFQQGQTMGGVTAASAIQVLQQAGEKRSRLMSDDTYESFKDIVYMVIELIRQFYVTPRKFRTTDKHGTKTFIEFSNSLMCSCKTVSDRAAEFDIDVVPQKENPFTREAYNNTILTFWQSGMFDPNAYDSAYVAISSMQFDGKEKLLNELEELHNNFLKQQEAAKDQAEAPSSSQIPAKPGGSVINPLSVPGGDMTQNISPAQGADLGGLIPIPLTGGA